LCIDGVITLTGTCSDGAQSNTQSVPAEIIVNTCKSTGYVISNCGVVLTCGNC
jgi:hypothetical protein